MYHSTWRIKGDLVAVWYMCVSYHRLNQVTLPFEYPSIPRCDDAINNFGDSNGRLYFISLDNKTGYHQIGVRFANQDKLAFFGPDGKKYTFNVMPFGSHNAPAFYTRMMLVFRGEYDSLFKERRPNDMAHKGSSTIIDNILLWPTSLDTLLAYSECVCSVFMKYRVTFQLKKCEFLTNRIKYVGHDITPNSNCPAQSKFDLITDWPLPATGQSLGSFISLVLLQHLLPFLWDSRSSLLQWFIVTISTCEESGSKPRSVSQHRDFSSFPNRGTLQVHISILICLSL